MILGIDGRLANARERAGVGRFCYEVLRALPAVTGPWQLRVYLDALPGSGFPVDAAQAEFRILRPRRFWTHRALGSEIRRDPPTVFFSPTLQMPLACAAPALVAVHDLAFLEFGAYFTARQRLTARLQARQCVLSAKHFLAISEATRDHLMRTYSVAADRITVCGAGCDTRFQPIDDAARLESVRKKFKLPERFVLYVGRLQPRKNIARLVEAFSLVRERCPGLPQHLVLAGGKGWLEHGIQRAIDTSPARDCIHLTGYVEDEDLPALMNAADVLALLSLWEGFGLPVLEAMACGTAVLTSNVSSLPEVGGDAAIQADPHDTQAISQALEMLLRDDALRDRVAARGIEQARRFTWEQTAHQVIRAAKLAAG